MFFSIGAGFSPFLSIKIFIMSFNCHRKSGLKTVDFPNLKPLFPENRNRTRK